MMHNANHGTISAHTRHAIQRHHDTAHIHPLFLALEHVENVSRKGFLKVDGNTNVYSLFRMTIDTICGKKLRDRGDDQQTETLKPFLPEKMIARTNQRSDIGAHFS